MSVLDTVIAVMVVGGAILGYHHGFISQLVSIAGLVISYIVAYQFFDVIAPWIRKMLPINSLASYNKFKFLVENLNPICSEERGGLHILCANGYGELST